MNRIMKFVPILLVLLVIFSITPVSATIFHKTPHIEGLKDVTIHQGENFTEYIKVVFNGIIKERGIECLPRDSIHINIYHQNGVEAYCHVIHIPRFWGNKVIIYSDLLSEGTYNMTVTFDGDYNPYRFRVFDPCNESATLTILPKESKI